ncbi:MAG: beta-1,3-glucanase family protein [Isosphaeraceae bacterium]
MIPLRTRPMQPLSPRHRRRRPLPIGFEEVERRALMASLPLSFAVPGVLANRGVYAGILGQLEAAYTPTHGPYAGVQLASGMWVVLATNPGDSLANADYAPATPFSKLTQAFAPSKTTPATMSVDTTLNFPASGGNLSVWTSGANPVNTLLSYTGLTPSTSFNGVLQTDGSGPTTYPAGSSVFLTGQYLPLLNLFPNAGSYPNTNATVTATVNVPSFLSAPITSGQVVMSVGSAMKLPVNNNGSIAAPNAASNPNDHFGLFEWGWDSHGGAQPDGALDIDISEVDQVGIPFQASITTPAVAITGVADAGNGLVTITTATPHGLQAGDTVKIAGVTGTLNGASGPLNVNGTTFVANAPADSTHFQINLPVTLGTYSSGGTVTLGMPAPAQDGMGLIPTRTVLFQAFDDYIAAVQKENPTSNAQVFLQGGAENSNAPFPPNTRITAPQDVVVNLQANPPILNGSATTGGSLTLNTNYYYAVTATSASGEAKASIPVMVYTYNKSVEGKDVPQQTAALSWSAFPYATGYKVYRSLSINGQSLTNPVLVATLSGGQTLSYNDDGSGTPTSASPPTNNYTYDPLNQYYTQAVLDFFQYYTNNDFVLDLLADTTRLVGRTSTTAVPGYTVLDLVAQAGQYGNQYAGTHVHIYSPLFSTNTNLPGLPAPPSWITDPADSPAAMIFGAAGVFGTPEPGIPAGLQKDIQNAIDSAFNRGLTPRQEAGGTFSNVIPPTYWANDPNPLIASGVSTTIPSGKQPLSGTYYYAITAVNLNASDTPAGETTPSNLVKVVLTGSQNSVLLQWKAINTTAKGVIQSSLPDKQTITVDSVAHFPASGQLLINNGGTPTLLSYGDIDTGTNTFQKVAVIGGGTFPTSGTVYGNIGASTADSINIYRGTSPDKLVLIANVPNGTPNAIMYVDNNGAAPAQSIAPPIQFYAKGSTANYYAAFLHQPGISINGLAYGYPYDDQGGFSTNIQMRTPQGVTISLLPWANAGALAIAGPTSVAAGQTVQYVLTARNATGDTDTSYRGTVHFTSDDPQAVLPGDYTFNSGDKGSHTFAIILKTAGTITITVADATNGLSGSKAVTVRAAAASKLSFLSSSLVGLTGTKTDVVVEAQDAFGNVATDVNGPVTLEGQLGRLKAFFKEGAAIFRLPTDRAGDFRLRAKAPWSSILSGLIRVTTVKRFTIAGPARVDAGRATAFQITSRKPGGLRNAEFSGLLEIYRDDRLVATTTARDGIADVSLVLIRPGRALLRVRDPRANSIVGTRYIRVR